MPSLGTDAAREKRVFLTGIYPSHGRTSDGTTNATPENGKIYKVKVQRRMLRIFLKSCPVNKSAPQK